MLLFDILVSIVCVVFFLFSDANIPAGTVLFTNGVPYTYQNGMAIFQSPEGTFPVPQPQVRFLVWQITRGK